MTSDAWKRDGRVTGAAVDLVDVLADVVAARVAEAIGGGAAPAVERLAYSPREAAEALGCSERHVRQMIATGEINAGRLGDRILISRPELQRLARGEAGAA